MKLQCQNCGVDTKRKRLPGFCSRCSYWLAKVYLLQNEIRAIPEIEKQRRNSRFASRKYRLHKALKILDELQWRGQGGVSRGIDISRITGLLFSLAAAARTSVNDTAVRNLKTLSSRGRKVLHDVLLSMVEDLPFRHPVLHLDEKWPIGAQFDGGWIEWQKKYWLLSYAEREKLDQECMIARQ